MHIPPDVAELLDLCNVLPRFRSTVASFLLKPEHKNRRPSVLRILREKTCPEWFGPRRREVKNATQD